MRTARQHYHVDVISLIWDIESVVEVIGTDEFAAWFGDLEEGHADAVVHVVDQLEERGVDLGFPQSSALQGAEYAMRELRVKAKGHQIRVIYIFDPKRQAVLLIGGDKTGDNRFYDWIVPLAARIWVQYAKEAGFKP